MNKAFNAEAQRSKDAEAAAIQSGERLKRITFDDWEAEGQRLFGEDRLKWRFQCPACGHVQAVEDFRPYKSQGATADTARFNCIGRYSVAKRRAFGGEGAGPCDYTSGGLFDIRPLTVVMPGGEEIRTFDFAPSSDSRVTKPTCNLQPATCNSSQ